MAILTANQGTFAKFNESQLDTQTKIYLGMIDKSTIKPQVSERLAAALRSYELFGSLLILAKSGNKEYITQKNSAKSELVDDMERLTIRINDVCMGDEALLKTTGLPLNGSKTRKPTKTVTQAQGIKVQSTRVGMLAISVMDKGNAAKLIYQYSLVPPTANTPWHTVKGNGMKTTIEGLPSLTVVYVRVLGSGAKDQLVASEVLACNVL